MSIPIAIATAFIRGGAGIEDFTEETIKDRKINTLAKRTIIVEDEELTSQVPEARKAYVEIKTYDNKVRTVMILQAKGEPENPMTDNEVIDNILISQDSLDLKRRAEKICKYVLMHPFSFQAIINEL